jgi:hypothetical protein
MMDVSARVEEMRNDRIGCGQGKHKDTAHLLKEVTTAGILPH